jgi:hypothetical protein
MRAYSPSILVANWKMWDARDKSIQDSELVYHAYNRNKLEAMLQLNNVGIIHTIEHF